MITLADYNPSVLQLVTLPNFVLAWALQQKGGSELLQEALSSEGELDLTPAVLEAFKSFLNASRISLSFMSGGWSREFVELLYSLQPVSPIDGELSTMVLGAETIYSPFALASFSDTLMSILQRERLERPNSQSTAIIAAKRLYFGVGGSLDDFVTKMRELGLTVDFLREETDGVRRGVVRCLLR
jgi:protein-histidine N-methyltransferase